MSLNSPRRLNIAIGLQFLIGKRTAVICDEDEFYFTMLCDGDFRRMGKPIFYERIGWDEKLASARLYSQLRT